MLSLNCSPQRDQTDIAPFIFFDPLHEFNIEIHWDLQIILLSKFMYMYIYSDTWWADPILEIEFFYWTKLNLNYSNFLVFYQCIYIKKFKTLEYTTHFI